MATINIPLALPIVEAVIEPVPWHESFLRIKIPPAACGVIVLPRNMFSDEVNHKTQPGHPGPYEPVPEVKQTPHAPGSTAAIVNEWVKRSTEATSETPAADDNPAPVPEMVERVVQAMLLRIRDDAKTYALACNSDESAGWIDPPFDLNGGDPRFDGTLNIISIAYAVIEAMLEPTTDMIDRMRDVGPDAPYGVVETIERWEAGIKAALGM